MGMFKFGKVFNYFEDGLEYLIYLNREGNLKTIKQKQTLRKLYEWAKNDPNVKFND